MSFTASALPHPDETIVAMSSAPGPGTRAIVRVSGPGTRDVIAHAFEPAFPDRRGYLVHGFLTLSGVLTPLPATLYFFPGPRSYTGQDLAELHTIGSPPLVERLVADLLTAGARAARPGEFTLRAFLAGKMDLTQAEAVNAVIEACTDADLRGALTQLAGGVSHPLDGLRDDLLNLLADLEAALDFADEDIEFVGTTETLGRIDTAIDQLSVLTRKLDDRTVSGRPVRVALVGRPNAGKSALFNALAGGTALVSSIPGTTRDYLTRRFELAGMQVELIDTAGWQTGADTIEEQAQRLAREQESRADVILWCDEAGRFGLDDARRLDATGAEIIRVRTKWDLVRGEEPPPVTASTVTVNGTESLREALVERVRALARPALAPSQSRCRHHVSACIDHLRAARVAVAEDEPPELAAAALRAALEQLAEMTGALHTTDLLDRIFSRFCIGK